MSEIAKVVGSKIRGIREGRDQTREDLAYHAGISATFLGDIERGKKEPSLQTLVKISMALEVPLRELLTGIETQFPEGLSKLELLQLLQPYLKERYSLQQAKEVCEFLDGQVGE